MADEKDGGTGASIVIKKIKKGGHAAHGGAWKVAYADFVTAMMAFFLVMWIMGLDQKTKEGVQKYFNDPIKFLIGAERVNTGVFEGVNGNQIVSNPNTGGLTDSQRSGGVSQLHLLARKIEAGMEAFKPEIFGLKVTPDRIQFAITAQSLFSPGSALLKSESEPLLNRIAGILKPLDANIMIEAHTDDLSPENPSFKTNWELSAVRAAVVTRYLVEGHMFEPGKLTAMGAAEYRPVADNSTPEGRAKNRRIDFYIVPDKNNRFGIRNTASEGTPPK